MKKIFIALTFFGILMPYAQLIPWLIEHGLNIPLLLDEAFSQPISRFAWFDVIVSAFTLFAVTYLCRKLLNKAELAIVIAGTLLVGVSLGFPLLCLILLNKKTVQQFFTNLNHS